MQVQPFAPGQEKQASRIYVEVLEEMSVGGHKVGPGLRYTHAWLPRSQVKRLSILKRVKMAQPPRPPVVEETQPEAEPETE